MSEAAQITTIICGCIISLATMIGVPIVTALVWRIHQNSVKTESNTAATAKHTNSIITQLVDTTAAASEAKGVIQGRAEQVKDDAAKSEGK
jgi:hypothetical protein